MENESQHDDDTMVDGFVWLDAEISPKSTLDYGIEHRLIGNLHTFHPILPKYKLNYCF